MQSRLIVLAVLKEITRCQEEFVRYECGPTLAIPGLRAYCDQLDECRSEDINSIPLAEITVKALASILNGFFNELTYKAMVRARVGLSDPPDLLDVLHVHVALRHRLPELAGSSPACTRPARCLSTACLGKPVSKRQAFLVSRKPPVPQKPFAPSRRQPPAS